MDTVRRDAGSTLLELVVVVGLIAVVVATFGAFFLAGPSTAVASAARDVTAALAETRATALAFDDATLVFAPDGNGWSARVYRGTPGDPNFAAASGPGYESAVDLTETAAPLGAPGIALRMDSHGSVLGYRTFTPGNTAAAPAPCPPGGAFTLALHAGAQTQSVAVPCAVPPSSVTPAVVETPSRAATAIPRAAGTCPANAACTLPVLAFGGATCPPSTMPDPLRAGVCDALVSGPATPVPTPTPATTTYTVVEEQVFFALWNCGGEICGSSFDDVLTQLYTDGTAWFIGLPPGPWVYAPQMIGCGNRTQQPDAPPLRSPNAGGAVPGGPDHTSEGAQYAQTAGDTGNDGRYWVVDVYCGG